MAQADADEDLSWAVSVDSTIVRAHQHAAGAREERTGTARRRCSAAPVRPAARPRPCRRPPAPGLPTMTAALDRAARGRDLLQRRHVHIAAGLLDDVQLRMNTAAAIATSRSAFPQLRQGRQAALVHGPLRSTDQFGRHQDLEQAQRVVDRLPDGPLDVLIMIGIFGLPSKPGAVVPGSLPVRFPGLLAEPVVRLSAQRALHGDRHQARISVHGLGMRAPRQRYRVTAIAAETGRHRPVGVMGPPAGAIPRPVGPDSLHPHPSA